MGEDATYPWNPGYNTVRLNYFPMAIIRCREVGDVALTLEPYLKHDLKFGLRRSLLSRLFPLH